MNVTLADPEKFTLATPPNALARLLLALCSPSIRETRELSACHRWSIPEMRLQGANHIPWEGQRFEAAPCIAF